MDAAAVSAITDSVDFSTVIVGIGAVYAAVVLVRIAYTGGRKLISSVRA